MINNQIILVRHGESLLNSEGRIQGQTDKESPLTEFGVSQMRATASWLSKLGAARVSCSPLLRAKQSASFIAEALGQSCVEDERLLEIDFGSWTGSLRSDVRSLQPEDYETWRTNPQDFELDGRRPVRELYGRLTGVVEELCDPNVLFGRQVIVAHKGPILALTSMLLDLPDTHHNFMQVDRAGVSVLSERSRSEDGVDYELLFANERPHALSFNRVDFRTEEWVRSYGEVFLVRHGQTKSNVERRYQGGQDVKLSGFGEQMVQELAESFSPPKPTRVVSSPLRRARDSARILADMNEIGSTGARDDLHEFRYGIWEGMTEDQVRSERPVEYQVWQQQPKEVDIPHAEDLQSAFERATGIWESYEADLKRWSGSILSVGHDIINRLILCRSLSLPPSYIWKFAQTNASVSVLGVKDSLDGNLRMLNHGPYSLPDRLSDDWL